MLYCSTRALGEFERQQGLGTFAETHLLIAADETTGRDDDWKGIEPKETAKPPDQSSWSASRSLAYSITMTDTGSLALPLAILRIRNLDIEVPVFSNTSERNLNRGAGLIEGTALPGGGGNVAIDAHRDGNFRALQDAKGGDVIELESHSQQQNYRIIEIAIVEPTDLWPLDDTDVSMVTLVTCFPFYFVGSAPQRFIVRAATVG